MLNYKYIEKFLVEQYASYRIFKAIFLLFTLFPVTFIGLFNYITDPYGVTKTKKKKLMMTLDY